jgi:hypothetical protein
MVTIIFLYCGKTTCCMGLLEEKLAQAKEKYIEDRENDFAKIVDLIRTSDKMGIYGKLGPEENCFHYDVSAPIKAQEGSLKDSHYLACGIVYVNHGIKIYGQFDTDFVTFDKKRKDDFIAIHVSRYRFEAITKPSARKNVDSYIENFSKMTADSMKNAFPAMAKMSDEAQIEYLADINLKLDVWIDFVLPNFYATQNFQYCNRPHLLVELKNQNATGLPLINSIMAVHLPKEQLIGAYEDVSERMLNPANIKTRKLPLQEAMYNYISNYLIPEIKAAK